MQAWNQWGAQGGGGSAYPVSGFPQAVTGVPPPGVGAVPVAPVPPPIPGYPTVATYSWPNYNSPAITPSPYTAGTQWSMNQQTQQWEHWQQWQQQYNQWQQHYGSKLGAGGTFQDTTAQAVSQSSPLTSVPSSLPSSSGIKRPNEDIGRTAETLPDSKKQKSDLTGTEWTEKQPVSSKETLAELSEAEKQFDEHFNNWESQFNTWREQNANHPDTEQYKAYEAKWKTWREQLLARREQMKKKREAKLSEAAKEQKQATQISNQMHSSPLLTGGHSTLPSSLNPALTTPTLPAPAVTQPDLTASFAQPSVGVYNQMGFPPYSFGMNQQNYMYGTPSGYPQQFPGVPPPVMPPSIQVPDLNSALKNAADKSTLGTSKESTLENSISKEKDSDFLKRAVGTSGIPGLDLLNATGNNAKQYGDFTGSSLLPLQAQLPIQTPADSKPFDFPIPSSGANSVKYSQQSMMHQLSMPPPGFPNMLSNYGMHPNNTNAYNHPPPNSNSQDPHSNTSKIPSLMDGFVSQPPSLIMDKNFKDILDRSSSEKNNVSAMNRNNFDHPRDMGFGGNSFDRTNQIGKNESPINSHFSSGPWTSNNFDNSNKTMNNLSGFSGGNSGSFPSATGPENEEDEYEKFHEYQQGISDKDFKDVRRGLDNKGEVVRNLRGPRGTRFSDREPPINKIEEGPKKDIAPSDLGQYNRDGFGEGKRWNDYSQGYDYNQNRGLERSEVLEKPVQKEEPPMKQEIPPILEPMIIFDYRHQPADLGTPDVHEPASLFDYAHGAHVMPTGEEDRFSHGHNSTRQYPDRWDGSDGRERNRGPLDKGGSPNRWGDSNRDYGFDSRNKWNSPGPRNQEDRRWESKDNFRRDRDREEKDDRERGRGRDERERGRDDLRSRSDRNKEDFRGRDKDDRWRSDRSKTDSNHDDRTKSNRDGDKRDRGRDKFTDDRKSSNRKSPSPKSTPNTEVIPSEKTVEDQKQIVVLVDDILNLPGRNVRPPKIVIILRGPPGSGKTFVAKLIKDKEVEMGGSAPRILSLDDYFMVEVDKEEMESETGKKVKKKVMEYEYEAGMEPNYRDSLMKSFRKTIVDGYFPFIIVDCINNNVSHFDEMVSFAKLKGFQVYICEMDMDISVCSKRNVHKRTEKEVTEMVGKWEKTPASFTILDVRSVLQDAAITEVDMEDSIETIKPVEENKPVEVAEQEQIENKSQEVKENVDKDKEEQTTEAELSANYFFSSKWDNLDSTFEKLDRLDGLAKARRPRPTITDWLQLPEDYFETSVQIPGKKRVRWADLEERRQQEKMRAIGFVVGQTDWTRMLDPSGGQSKLTQTKYI